MPSLNKVFLMGNLTRDPEVRYTPQGTPVAEFGVAVNRVYRGKSGQQVEDTCFVDVTAWGNQAQTIEKYLRKGSPIFVEGRLTYSQWETREGEKRSKLRVTLENFQFLDSQRDRGLSGEAAAPKETGQPQGVAESGAAAPEPPAEPVRDDLALESGGGEEEVPF